MKKRKENRSLIQIEKRFYYSGSSFGDDGIGDRCWQRSACELLLARTLICGPDTIYDLDRDFPSRFHRVVPHGICALSTSPRGRKIS